MSIAMLRLAVALLAALAAQSLSSPAGHLAVYTVHDNDWQEAFRTPNATGSVPIKGFNLSTPFPGVESDNWAWTIQVRDGLPRSDNRNVATGIWIQLDMPDNLVRLAPNGTMVLDDGSWRVCESIWEFSTLNSDAATVDGSCEGIVPKECHDLWTRELSEGFGRRVSNTSQCPSLTPPSQCLDVLGKDYTGVGNSSYSKPPKRGISTDRSSAGRNLVEKEQFRSRLVGLRPHGLGR